ncbi:MAG: HAD-IB family phosphatase [Verrucomicrobiota bacterium]
MSPTRCLEVSIDDQTLTVLHDGRSIRRFDISTATKGMGFVTDSYRTPTGRFRISEKIGDGEPSGTIFKKRIPVGRWQSEQPADGDLVLSRILRLEGLDPENANSMERFIYIHGTNHEDKLGHPASQGCVRLANAEMIELFDLVDVGTEMVIRPATKRSGKLFFIDCDSTLSTIEGIDELARARGDEVFQRVVDLTHAAMNGEVPIGDVFFKRMEMIRPDRALCERIAALYIDTIVPGAADLIRELKQEGWLPVILSGGFAPLIKPLADLLGIDHVEAVPVWFNDDGSYKGYGEDYPTTRNLGKNEVIREWRNAMLPERVMMMGDGMSDLETKPDVDLFIGFGGVVARPKVRHGCDYWLVDMNDRSELKDIISSGSMNDRMV